MQKKQEEKLKLDIVLIFFMVGAEIRMKLRGIIAK